ncbi:PH domain-containing protein [Streptomyces sp. NPDC004262]
MGSSPTRPTTSYPRRNVFTCGGQLGLSRTAACSPITARRATGRPSSASATPRSLSSPARRGPTGTTPHRSVHQCRPGAGHHARAEPRRPRLLRRPPRHPRGLGPSKHRGACADDPAHRNGVEGPFSQPDATEPVPPGTSHDVPGGESRAIFCVVFWVARLTFVPFVEVGPENLRVHNVFETYGIPWRAVRGIRDDPRPGVVVDLDDRRTVRLQAFTRWPSSGRHQKLVDRLEEARRAAPAEGGTSVTEGRTSGDRGVPAGHSPRGGRGRPRRPGRLGAAELTVPAPERGGAPRTRSADVREPSLEITTVRAARRRRIRSRRPRTGSGHRARDHDPAGRHRHRDAGHERRRHCRDGLLGALAGAVFLRGPRASAP